MRTSSSMSVITANAPPIRPPGLAVGEQRDADPPRVAVCAPIAPLARDGRPGECTLDVALQLREGLAGQDFAHGVSEQVVRRGADPVAERLVREADLELTIEVEDRRADAVDDEPQPVLALPRLELELLKVVDVGVSDEDAADVALRRRGPGSSRRESRSAAGPASTAAARTRFARRRGRRRCRRCRAGRLRARRPRSLPGRRRRRGAWPIQLRKAVFAKR